MYHMKDAGGGPIDARKITNRRWLELMGDEELAEWISNRSASDWASPDEEHHLMQNTKDDWLKWLKEEHK